MRKKDYELIASAVRDVYEYQKDNDGAGSKKLKQGAIRVTVDAIADALATQDANFKRDRFFSDCGIPDYAHN